MAPIWRFLNPGHLRDKEFYIAFIAKLDLKEPLRKLLLLAFVGSKLFVPDLQVLILGAFSSRIFDVILKKGQSSQSCSTDDGHTDSGIDDQMTVTTCSLQKCKRKEEIQVGNDAKDSYNVEPCA